LQPQASRPLNTPGRPGFPEDLALVANDLDFAGGQLPATQVVRPRTAEIPPHVIHTIVIHTIVRRTAPPLVAESDVGTPFHGTHRRWLAGLAGVLSTMLFTLLLLSLSPRPGESGSALPPAQATVSELIRSRRAEAIQSPPELSATSLELPWRSPAEWMASDD